MVASVSTVAFCGIEARAVDVQVQVASGLPAFSIVGLPDKAVGESRERIRAALHAIGLALPPKRITVNLAPADLPKEGSHYDLPIALALLAALGVVSPDQISGFIVVGELSLDGTLQPVAGALPAALAASSMGRGLICPQKSGAEAAWAGEDLDILAPHSVIALVNHFKGTQVLTPPTIAMTLDDDGPALPDFADIRGQEQARRALEIAAAGGHNLLMIGPPGAGKSMLAERLPSILPPLTSREMLDVSMIRSMAGDMRGGRIDPRRPFRSPHHSASMAAMVGGGLRVRPGEVSLAHKGVLFLDELPEFDGRVLESLRQPMESGMAVIARANHHVSYPARFQMIAAMNPCKCGYAGEPGHRCPTGPQCAERYRARLSGPLVDRIDMVIEVPAVSVRDLMAPASGEASAAISTRVAAARRRQLERFAQAGLDHLGSNAELGADAVEEIANPSPSGRAILGQAADTLGLSARGYYRVLRVARTLADLDGDKSDASCGVQRHHITEALAYRRVEKSRQAA
ncbi:MG(2+) CHELATASE FAMILY PROTEIN / ComM-related protein [hydrothermal vent metagenome]|uniref:MG(2+) CHELATASE FAMILY PROTEIN / ComM-related protein n=1 Tax=hydrothermal vent metagenome TaxID=652676 RepID=A0A3B0T088_9ZZZZ